MYAYNLRFAEVSAVLRLRSRSRMREPQFLSDNCSSTVK